MRPLWSVVLALTVAPPLPAQLFGRNGPGEAKVEWAAMFGSELWPDSGAGFFADFGVGVVGTIGGTTPGGHYGGMTLRALMGWAF